MSAASQSAYGDEAAADFASRELELDRALDLVASYVATPLGRREVLERRPSADVEEVGRRRRLLAEALTLRRAGIRLRFQKLSDPEEALSRLELEGAVLDVPEIANLARLARTVEDLAADVRASDEALPALTGAVRLEVPLDGFVRDVGRALSPEGGIADAASSELAAVRRRRVGATERLQRSLQRHIDAARDDGSLQDEFVTQRNNRFVIPIRADSHRAVDGIVHGTSTSGVTLFVEPMETVSLNNDLVRLADQERAEEHRVLTRLTARAREHRRALGRASAIVARLDFLAAAATWAGEIGGVGPEPAMEGALSLDRVRHPVLHHRLRGDGGEAVPIDVRLGIDESTLIVSGPNTGGKTVALKTIGLSALLYQCGLPIVADRAALPVFRQVLADIGDHQSITTDLSTFSSHVSALVRMIDHLRRPALVLIDELGTGTDPEEGTALAIALLDHLRERDVRTVITTHHNGLKAYAETTPGVVNAAVELDEEALRPTYRLIRGAAGRSGGLDIAARLGLAPEIVQRARGLISEQGRITARYVARLAELAAAAEDDREAARRELEKARLESLESARRLERQEAKERGRLEGERRRREKTLDALVKDTVRRLEERLERQVARRETERARKDFARRARQAVAPPATAGPVAPGADDIRPGDRVRLGDKGREAIVEEVHDDGRLTVAVGPVRWVVARDSLLPARPAARRPGAVAVQAGDDAPAELNLIGQRVDEALDNLERALDRALLAGSVRLRVVHGHGQGRLKRAVRERLASHPLVARHAPGGPGEGGDGATIVHLRE